MARIFPLIFTSSQYLQNILGMVEMFVVDNRARQNKTIQRATVETFWKSLVLEKKNFILFLFAVTLRGEQPTAR